jgi:CHASE3 domain sensor protein
MVRCNRGIYPAVFKIFSVADFPNSPFNLAQSFLSELQQGLIAKDEFLRRLDLFEQNVENWHTQLEEIPATEDYQEGQDLLEDAKESLHAVYEALGLLRDYAENGHEESAQEAMEMIQEASDFMIQLIQVTEQNMDDLEDDRSNPIGGHIVG